MQKEISRIYGDAGYTISFVSSNADYSLNVNARGSDYNSFYRNLSAEAVGVTGRNGLQISRSGRVFVDRLVASAGSAASYGQNSNNLGIALGRVGAHEIGHYLLQQAFDSSNIQGVMHARFHGEQWYSQASRIQWTFDASQIGRLGSKVCITPVKAPLDNQPIGPRAIGFGGGSGFGGGGGYPGWWYSMQAFSKWVSSIGLREDNRIIVLPD